MNRTAGRRELTIIVSGMIAEVPHQGGLTWVVLQYLLGLRKLGHNVYFVEPISESAVQPMGDPLDSSINAAYFRRVMSAYGLERCSALCIPGMRQSIGLPYDELARAARDADVLINIGGLLRDEEIMSDIPICLYLDVDPVFTQFWHAIDGIDMGFAGHTHFATVGLTINHPESVVPDCGKSWLTTVPPIALDCWPVQVEGDGEVFTTIANWRGYGSVEHDGVFYGQKVHSWRDFMELPVKTHQQFTVALAIHPDEARDIELLQRNHWTIIDPEHVSASPESYQRFVRQSRAEIGIAKSGYVIARSGWCSDRSVCYLAAGRPVIAQDTGFGDVLPNGEGLLAFSTLDDAIAAVEAVNSDYARHARAARQIAEEVFNADVVLPELLRQLGAT